jgi:hypothetical protein
MNSQTIPPALHEKPRGLVRSNVGTPKNKQKKL